MPVFYYIYKALKFRYFQALDKPTHWIGLTLKILKLFESLVNELITLNIDDFDKQFIIMEKMYGIT